MHVYSVAAPQIHWRTHYLKYEQSVGKSAEIMAHLSFNKFLWKNMDWRDIGLLAPVATSVHESFIFLWGMGGSVEATQYTVQVLRLPRSIQLVKDNKFHKVCVQVREILLCCIYKYWTRD